VKDKQKGIKNGNFRVTEAEKQKTDILNPNIEKPISEIKLHPV
jgi:hypothetical protein